MLADRSNLTYEDVLYTVFECFEFCVGADPDLLDDDTPLPVFGMDEEDWGVFYDIFYEDMEVTKETTVFVESISSTHKSCGTVGELARKLYEQIGAAK